MTQGTVQPGSLLHPEYCCLHAQTPDFLRTDRLTGQSQINRSETAAGAAALGQQLTQARAQLEATRADNVALVERLKYVQGYAGRKKRGEPAVGLVKETRQRMQMLVWQFGAEG